VGHASYDNWISALK